MPRKVSEINSIDSAKTGAVAKHIDLRFCDTHAEIIVPPLLLVDVSASTIRGRIGAFFFLRVCDGQSRGKFVVAYNE